MAFAAVYGLTAGLVMLWSWLGLPDRRVAWACRLSELLALAIIGYGLANATTWQNAVHLVAGMEPVETARPFIIAGVAVALAVPALALGRLFRRLTVMAANRLARLFPPRVALSVGLVLTAALFWSVGNGVLATAVLRTLDGTAQQVDALIQPDLAPPENPLKSGSPESLLSWEGLGARGRARITAFPDAGQIEALTGQDAMEPLRVYVGLNSAETVEERADLALAELLRTDAFSREVLVIATPTGTGWIDPSSVSALEFLWRGDVASVSVQYSYLSSWMSLLVEPEYGEETARAVFDRIYRHWRSLRPAERPRLYLHGLSLGSLNSELSANVWNILSEPYDGAFWVGPTFANPLHAQFTAARNPGSPAWRPRLGYGQLVRFATQSGIDAPAAAPWGPVRILYLQYPSDAVVFFGTASAWRPPAWMRDPPAPDVTPAFRWVPVVTTLQLLADLFAAFNTQPGHGHVYLAEHYIDGWVALTEPPGWDDDAMEALRDWYRARGR